MLSPKHQECPHVKNYKRRLNPVWHRMLYSCTHNGNSGHQKVNLSQIAELANNM